MKPEEYRQLKDASFRFLFRLTQNRADAEDVFQEALARCLSRYGDVAGDLRVLTTASRLAINVIRDRQRRYQKRSQLPEPVATDQMDDPSDLADFHYSLMVALSKLDETSRAVFLLRTMFDLDYEQISDCVQRRPDHCRQLYRRAQRKVTFDEPEPPSNKDRELADRLFTAVRERKIDEVISLLSPDVELVTDGGESGPALKRPLTTPAEIATFACASLSLLPTGLEEIRTIVGGLTASCLFDGEQCLVAVLVTCVAEKVERIYVVTDEQKLAQLPRPVT